MSIDIIALTASKNYTDKQIEKASIKGADLSRYVQTVNGIGPDENGNVEIEGGFGEDGYSPIANVSQNATGAVITITDKTGTTTATITNGKDGADGAKGEKGEKGDTGAQGIQGIQGEKGDTGAKGDKGDTGATGSAGKDGTSVTVKSVSESTADGGSNVVTFSDGKTVTIKNGSKGSTGATGAKGDKGEKGDKGDTGAQGIQGATGATGATGKDGKDYVLTAADKTEIAEQVENATIVQAPKYVHSVDEMTDVNRPYVLISTGRIWANAETTVEKEVTVTDAVTATTDNPYTDASRFANDASTDSFTSGATGYHITPLIDLTKYEGKTIQIHLEGCQYAAESGYANYIQCRLYGSEKNILVTRSYVTGDASISNGIAYGSLPKMHLTYVSGTSAILTIETPLTYAAAQIPVGYIRFCGKGAVEDSKISVTYQDMQSVTGVQWFDTGTTYAPTLSTEEKEAMVEEVAELVDAQLLTVIGDGVVTV